jgi:hypothetical protein
LPSRSAEERALIARIASETSWANTADPSARTAPARQAMLDRFEHQVDPEGVLPPEERARRAQHARKAYFLGLARKSVDARRRKAAANDLRALADQLEAVS